MATTKEERNDVAYRLEMLSHDLEATTQTLNAICVAADSGGTVRVGSRALFCPCKELFRISNELKELTDKVYQIVGEGAE